MSSEFSLVTTTCESLELAQRMARVLLEAQLAGCVQIMPINSFYTWEGVIEQAQEHLMLIKSKTCDWEKLAFKIRQMHTAQVPQIIRVDIADADQAYAQWLRVVTFP